jgi:methylmalonyl-CoA/ethylmalonyl-CoA epimerase
MEAGRAFFSEVFGASVTEAVTDPIQKVQVCFARFDGGTVELVAPAGEGSPVDAVLKKGGGCYHLCFETDDIEAEIARLRQHRFLPTGAPAPAVAFDQRRICFLYSREGRLIELVEAPEG